MSERDTEVQLKRQEVTRDKLGKFRTRLLDLSNRNRLLNYRHRDAARQIRIVDTSLAALYDALQRGTPMRFIGVPKDDEADPIELEDALQRARLNDEEYLAVINDDEASDAAAETAEVELRKRVRVELGLPPERTRRTAAQVAEALGIETEFELPRSGMERDTFQALLFDEQLRRKLSAIREEASSSIQERGVNTLYFALAFLEWFESDSSSKAIHSPLLLYPIELTRSVQVGNYVFSARGLDEDVETNVTLAERLLGNFHFTLPSFDVERPLEDFLRSVDLAIAPYKRWRVRTFATVGLFDFTRLAMYKDLDPEARPSDARLEQHPILLDLLGGAIGGPDGATTESEWPEDPLDRRAPLLITDADASQFAAIRTGVSGRSFVIEGPPGTGKSQTITNLIAAAMSAGKTVLFVADKLAALEVVKNRLDDAGIGEFCLELHSTKARKGDFYEALRKRLNLKPPRRAGGADPFAELQSRRALIDGYCDSMHSILGRYGLSVHELIWREQRLKLSIGDDTSRLQGQSLPAAQSLTQHDVRDLTKELANVAERRRSYDAAHGSIRLHPLASIGATDLTPHDVAALGAALEMMRQAAFRIPRLLIELDIERDGLTTSYEMLGAVVATLKELASIEPRPDRSDVAVVEGLGNLEGSATLIERFRSVCELLEQWHPDVIAAIDSAPELLGEVIDLMTAHDIADRAAAERVAASCLERLQGLQAAERARRAISAVLPSIDGEDRHALETVVSCVAVFGQSDKRALSEFGGSVVRMPQTSAVEGLEATAKAIREELLLRDKEFDLALIDDPAALRHAAAAIREANFFSALFSKEVRNAERLYRRLSIAERPSTRLARASRLVDVADVCDERRAFDGDERQKRAFGEAFAGIETDFALLRGSAECGDALRDKLVRGGSAGLSIEQAIAALDGRACIALKAIGEGDDFQALERLCKGRPADKTFADLSSEVEAAARDMASIEARLATLNVGFTTNLTSLVDLQQALAQRRSTIEDVRRDADATKLLGDRFDPRTLAVKSSALRFVRAVRGSGAEGLRQHCRLETLLDEHARLELVASAESLDEAVRQIVDVASVDVDGMLHGPRNEATLSTIADAASAMAAHLADLPDWLQNTRATQRLAKKHLTPLLEICVEAGIDPSEALEYVLVRTLVRTAVDSEPALRDVVGKDIAAARTAFRAADLALLRQNREGLRSDLAARHVDPGSRVGNRSTWTGAALIDLEAGKSRRHSSLRDVMRRSGKALQQLKPCFMMSPLSVAQFIPPGALQFDLLVIDEASQMRPEDALGAVSRASQIVVVGDPKQLPPTPFFNKAVNVPDDDPDDDAADIESVLDLSLQQYGRPRRLLWHYRSRHDSLIAFSNRHFYDDELQVFPSPDHSGDLGVRYRFVRGKYKGGVNPIEAARVAERAIEIMKSEPDKSLAVVSMNQAQRELIRMEFDRRALYDASAQRYVEDWSDRLEPFIVKNLESIQGDERDVVLISTVYGPDAANNVFQRFGPINGRTGWRRLNVLFTRAKQRVEVLSSMHPGDVIVDEKTSRGARALRDYLEYASVGRLDSGTVSSREPDSDFEVAVSQYLGRLGFRCVPQVGVAGFFIDIGVVDPRDGGRFILGIECDGSSYHSSMAARDRDRLKDEVLTRLGWHLHRIWSTDWFSDPAREVERIVRVIKTLAPDASESPDNRDEPMVTQPASRAQSSLQLLPNISSVAPAASTTVDDLLLDSDVLGAIRKVLVPGETLERDKLHRSIASTLGQPMSRGLRSAVNRAIAAEVRAGRLQVDASWSVVRRPL